MKCISSQSPSWRSILGLKQYILVPVKQVENTRTGSVGGEGQGSCCK